MSRPQANMKLKGSTGTKWSKWKKLLAPGKTKVRTKLKAVKKKTERRKWKMQAQNMALQQHRATRSAATADRKIVAVAAVVAEGVLCADDRGINRRGRCRRSVICSRKDRKFWSRLPKSRLQKKVRASPATSLCPAAIWFTCPRCTTRVFRARSHLKKSAIG